MKVKELRELAEPDLVAKEQEAKTELMKLYGQVSTGTPPKSPGQITVLKKTIARIKTLQKERETQAASPKEAAKKSQSTPAQEKKPVTEQAKE
jgi:large subunit ribosomal protein L29